MQSKGSSARFTGMVIRSRMSTLMLSMFATFASLYVAGRWVFVLFVYFWDLYAVTFVYVSGISSLFLVELVYFRLCSWWDSIDWFYCCVSGEVKIWILVEINVFGAGVGLINLQPSKDMIHQHNQPPLMWIHLRLQNVEGYVYQFG